MKPQYLIGIDPDLDKSGVAVYDLKAGKYTYVETLYLWEYYFVTLQQYRLEAIHFLIEDSNLIKGSFHGASARSNVGKNKAVSKLIVDFCKAHNISHTAIKPDGYSQYFFSLGKAEYISLFGMSDLKSKKVIAEIDKLGKEQYVHLVGKDVPNNKETRSAVAIIECNKHLYR
jgi:hypothetical protein